MISEPKDQKRIRWAQDNINALLRQRSLLDRKISEYRAFIAMLDESDLAVANGKAPDASLADLVSNVLQKAGGRAMSAAEVTNEIERRGFKPAGKTKLRTLIGIELPRQARDERRGVVRVSTGLYAIPVPGEEIEP